MSRKLKTLGLAFIAVFAMSAVAASGASAVTHHFTSPVETTYLTAKSLGEQKFYFTTSNQEEFISCNEVNVRNSTQIGKTLTEITVEPVYGNEEHKCVAYVNGQNLVLGVRTKQMPFYVHRRNNTHRKRNRGDHATGHLKCDTAGAGAGIELKVTSLTLNCAIIEPQTLHGVRCEEDPSNNNALIVNFTVHGIHSTPPQKAPAKSGRRNTQ